jgi:hypothetical protein
VATRTSSDGSITPPPSLEFHTDSTFDLKPSTENSIYPGEIPEARNGTLMTEAATYLMFLETGAEHLDRAINSETFSLHLNNAAKKIKELGELFADSLNDRMNQAMQGRDATAILHKAQNLVPTVSLPTKQHAEKLLDEITDTVQQMLTKEGHESPFTNEDFEGAQWEFSRVMGRKAKEALLNQQICFPWQVVASRTNIHWQISLVQALADLYELVKGEYYIRELIEMTPAWIGDRENKTWRLIIDAGIDAIDKVTLTDKPILLYPVFELAEKEGMVKVADYTRGTKTVDNGEWENVESMKSSISAPSFTDKSQSGTSGNDLAVRV